jgi:SAM-dependent methyltransferase
MKPPDIDQLRAYWNAYASVIQNTIEPATLLLARAVMAHLRLDEAGAVLEVGTGTGAAAEVTHGLMPRGARLVATDLSPNMVERARARLPAEVEVDEVNCEDLPYDSGSFDRLLCNLAVMLTPEPDKAFAEAHRVLCPGGIAGWSVWGRSEQSHMFTLPARVAQTVGLELPSRRSNFHLGDRARLRERVAAHGFEPVVVWHQAMMPCWRDGGHFADLILTTPRWTEITDSHPEPIRRAFRDELVRLADELIQAGEPIGLDALIVIAHRA